MLTYPYFLKGIVCQCIPRVCGSSITITCMLCSCNMLCELHQTGSEIDCCVIKHPYDSSVLVLTGSEEA